MASIHFADGMASIHIADGCFLCWNGLYPHCRWNGLHPHCRWNGLHPRCRWMFSVLERPSSTLQMEWPPSTLQMDVFCVGMASIQVEDGCFPCWNGLHPHCRWNGLHPHCRWNGLHQHCRWMFSMLEWLPSRLKTDVFRVGMASINIMDGCFLCWNG